METEQVLVVGAGPAGLCVALALAARGMEVDVVERQRREALAMPAFDGREIALTHGSMRILRQLGVWDRIPLADISPLRLARVLDGDHPGFEVAPAGNGSELGALVPNHAIRKAAWEAVADNPAITVHDGVSVEAVGSEEDAAWVRLDDGRTLSARLLVAADSRFSPTRRAMGIPLAMHDFGKTMLVSRVRHEIANDGVAWEWFGEGQTRAFLPVATHLASAVLTVTGAEAARLQALSAQAYADELGQRYEGRFGRMEPASPVHAYPLVATWAKRFVGRRFALAGDAAVGMHPVTAHGFNLGLDSVARLAEAVGSEDEGRGDPGDARKLARYERRHRLGSLPLFAGTALVVGLYTDDRASVRPLRRGILRGMRWLPPLRKLLAAQLMDPLAR